MKPNSFTSNQESPINLTELTEDIVELNSAHVEIVQEASSNQISTMESREFFIDLYANTDLLKDYINGQLEEDSQEFLYIKKELVLDEFLGDYIEGIKIELREGYNSEDESYRKRAWEKYQAKYGSKEEVSTERIVARGLVDSIKLFIDQSFDKFIKILSGFALFLGITREDISSASTPSYQLVSSIGLLPMIAVVSYYSVVGVFQPSASAPNPAITSTGDLKTLAPQLVVAKEMLTRKAEKLHSPPEEVFFSPLCKNNNAITNRPPLRSPTIGKKKNKVVRRTKKDGRNKKRREVHTKLKVTKLPALLTSVESATKEKSSKLIHITDNYLDINKIALDKHKAHYLERFIPAAISQMGKTNISASVLLSFGIVMSEWGQNDQASISNNHFLLSCSHAITKTIDGRISMKEEDIEKCIHSFAIPEDSYRKFAQLISYSLKDEHKATVPKELLYRLKELGYIKKESTLQKMVAVMDDYNLKGIDKESGCFKVYQHTRLVDEMVTKSWIDFDLRKSYSRWRLVKNSLDNSSENELVPNRNTYLETLKEQIIYKKEIISSLTTRVKNIIEEQKITSDHTFSYVDHLLTTYNIDCSKTANLQMGIIPNDDMKSYTLRVRYQDTTFSTTFQNPPTTSFIESVAD